MATVHHASIELEGGGHLDVALKRLHPQMANDPRFVEDFVREAKIAAKLSHPNIVRILELGRIGTVYFIAMDLVHGKPLLTLMRKAFLAKRPAPIGVVLSIVSELCDALDYAHTGVDEYGQPFQIVHRDLSPSNLLITDDGHVKVIDFGIAKTIGAGKLDTAPGLVKGKLGYMPVEAFTGARLDARADVFSAGIVMWELLACKRLFKAQNRHDMVTMMRDAPIAPPSAHNPECPSELDAVVLKALARPLADRWQSAAEMRAALEEVRRYYRDRSSPRTVAHWNHKLRTDSAVTNARGRASSRSENILQRLTTGDLRDVLDAVDHLEDIPDNSHFDPPSNPYVDIRVVRAPTATSPSIDTEETRVRVRAISNRDR
jgi:serine/threonine protein kinase